MEKKIRILWINPVSGTSEFDEKIKKVLNSVKRNDVEVTVTSLSKGPPHLEYKSYEPLVLVETLEKIVEAERNGYDAVIIGCFDDPGLQEARELVNIPVIGPGEACMHIACTLGHKFSIVTVKKEALARLEDHVYMYGLEKKVASFRFINIGVMEMEKDPEKVYKTILREAKKAIEEDNAEVIVLGCTVETGFMDKLIEELKVPVVDATVVAFKFAEMLADLKKKTGLSHSKVYGYRGPSEDEMLIGAV
jgi:allantoin racemase